MRTIYQLAGAAIVLAAGVGGWYALEQVDGASATGGGPGGRPGGDAVPVEVSSARTATVERAVSAVGTTLARESIDVVAEVPGRIRAINFEEGQAVQAGAVLFELDRGREEAEVRELQAQVDDARIRLRRSEALFQDRSVPEAQRDEDRAALESAEARLAGARTRFEERYIRAPFDGVTGLREASIGAYVSAGTLLTTLDDLERMRLEFSVPERFLGSLEPGLPVVATSAGFDEQRFEGEVVRLGARVDPVSRSVTVQSELENADRLLRPGMFMNVRLVIGRRENAVVVPEESLLVEGQRKFAYRITDDTAERVEVETGVRRRGEVEITNGLEAGDLVVVAGLQRLRDGVSVRITEEHGDEGVALTDPAARDA